MAKLSIIIPARGEIFLSKTISDILEKAVGEIEIFAILDGYWPTQTDFGSVHTPPFIEDPRVKYIHFSSPRGPRNGVNTGAALATGKFLLKCDAHCMFAPGFDEVLKADWQDDWVVIPRRHRLDAENWCIQESTKHKVPIDYEYLSAPGHYGADGNKWNKRTRERLNDPAYLIDENLTFQASCWFMTKNHFDNFLHGMSDEGYGTMPILDAEEIGLKTWLGGGKVITNKKTWYAHLHKGPKYGRMFFIDKREAEAGKAYSNDFWFNNRWTEAKHDLAWLIERFWPVPSWTPELVDQVRKK